MTETKQRHIYNSDPNSPERMTAAETEQTRKQAIRDTKELSPGQARQAFSATPFDEWLEQQHTNGMCLIRTRKGTRVTLMSPSIDERFTINADHIGVDSSYRYASAGMYQPFLVALATDPKLPLDQPPPCDLGCGRPALILGTGGTVLCSMQCTVPRPKPKASKVKAQAKAKENAVSKRTSRRQPPA